MGRIKVTIKITQKSSRYEKEKKLGELYRREAVEGESFTIFRKRKKEEEKEKIRLLNL